MKHITKVLLAILLIITCIFMTDSRQVIAENENDPSQTDGDRQDDEDFYYTVIYEFGAGHEAFVQTFFAPGGDYSTNALGWEIDGTTVYGTYSTEITIAEALNISIPAMTIVKDNNQKFNGFVMNEPSSYTSYEQVGREMAEYGNYIITDQMVIYAFWSNPVTTASITVASPEAGSSVNLIAITDNYYEPDVYPTVTVSDQLMTYGNMEEAPLPDGVWVKEDNFDDYFEGTFVDGNTYYARVNIFASFGYYMDDNIDSLITFNGKSPLRIVGVGGLLEVVGSVELHDYGTPTYEWADDNSTVKATVVCRNNAEHKVEETVNTSYTVTTQPGCDTAGVWTYTAIFTSELFSAQTKEVTLPATGHSWGEPSYVWSPDNSSVTASRVCNRDSSHREEETAETTSEVTAAPTCTEEGTRTYTAVFTNGAFLTQTKEVTIPATGHTPADPVEENRTEATCTEAGHYDSVVYCTVCHEELSRETIVLPALGHDWKEPVWTWAEDYSTAEAVFTCSNDASHVERIEADITVVETETEYVYTATVIFEDETYTDTKTVAKELDGDYIRIYRESRLTESIKVADELKKVLGVEKFNNIIVAKDSDFADALSGSYLAARKEAPILLVNNGNHEEAYGYIRSSLSEGGAVYILGGESAVSASFEQGLLDDPYSVIRIAGSSRYTTNLDILKEAGMTSSGDIFVVTGTGYADSLSSASVGLPILMVDNNSTTLKNSQKKFLQANVTGRIYILGDTPSVSRALEKQLKTYGSVTRIGGSSRWETTRLIAEKFFNSPECVTLATGNDFADGLIASPLAYALHSPLLMCASNKTGNAKTYVSARPSITKAYIVGSKDNISDEAARKILLLDESVVILER